MADLACVNYHTTIRQRGDMTTHDYLQIENQKTVV